MRATASLDDPNDHRKLGCGYSLKRLADGTRLLAVPYPTRPALGCALPAAALVARGIAIGSGFGGLLTFMGLTGAAFLAVFTWIGTRAWRIRGGSVCAVHRVGPWTVGASQFARAESVVLRRDIWPDRRGSTDSVAVLTDAGRLHVLEAFNFEVHETRLGNAGHGSWGRSGPELEPSRDHLAMEGGERLLQVASPDVVELTRWLATSLSVPIGFAAGRASSRPDDVD